MRYLLEKSAGALCLFVLLVAGCGGGDGKTVAADPCLPGQLATEKPGALTVATDRPALPPYFEDQDPSNGKGFESAVAYAIAERLGYPPAKVRWTVEPLRFAYERGSKDYDFYVNQIPISSAREGTVDFSSPYYTVSQAVVALKKNAWIEPDFLPSMERVKMGAQRNSSSLAAIEEWIVPREKPTVFGGFGEVAKALEEERVEAVVLELPAALDLAAGRLPEAHVVGQFAAPNGERWGAVLEDGSTLTPCVSRAIGQLRESGELGEITDRWTSEATGIPMLR